MSPAVEIKTLLDLLGTLPPLKVGFLPDSPSVIGVIYTYGSWLPERQFGVTGMFLEKPTIQVVFRGEPFDFTTPDSYARIAYQALASVQPGALCEGVTTIYREITPLQSPFQIRAIDNNNRHTIGFNALVVRES